ncbi:hypothetical protein TRFO_37847 [Tritrichomonas foetus]|uniref:Uncharacterized protein n=1 Tax=Tritrichomonas foetus TaxID=1144522 RepID=A0A1J4JA01_9EUKA|nr:hypothetical protein TRFO_37847 [Tritrichomonas foetus]|eukprot:OHS95984.1 hypothetical protein TRFO_37847 [Tritrichomonas foetus]
MLNETIIRKIRIRKIKLIQNCFFDEIEDTQRKLINTKIRYVFNINFLIIHERKSLFHIDIEPKVSIDIENIMHFSVASEIFYFLYIQ